MTPDKFNEAATYDASQLSSKKLTERHVAALTVLWQQQNGLTVDGKAGPNTIASIEAWISANVTETTNPSSPLPPGIAFYDRRSTAAQSHGGGQWPVTDRPITNVTGICLHQTACNLGERVERYDTVGAHLAVTRAGKVIWLHDWDRRVCHGNGWNNGTVGIEIDGLYAGVEGDPSTVWDDPSTPTREQGMVLTAETINAVKAAIRWIKADVERASGKVVNALVAHRQSSASRRNDPGSAIWKQIALPLHAELHMSDGGIGFKLDDGYPIPEAWDPRCTGQRY